MSCPGPEKYDDLPEVPAYGSVMVRGERSEWMVDVPIEQGRDMEDDGVPVYWVVGSVPELIAELGLVRCWLWLYRVFTWPSRLFR